MKQIKKQLSQELPFLYAIPAVVWQVLFLSVPLLIVIYLSFVKDNLWSLENYTALLTVAHVRVIGRSLGMALANVLLCLLCAYPVAYFLAMRVKRFKSFLIFLLVLPFWTNFLVQVYAWYFLLGTNGLLETVLRNIGLSVHIANSLTAVFLVMVYCYIPFMILPIYSIIEKLQHQLLEASADLGATPWQTFVRVTLPLSMPGIKTGVLLVMVPSFGEFVIPELMGGAKYMMNGSLISYYFLVARDNGIGAAFTMVSGFVLLTVAVIFHKAIRTPIDQWEED
jgi:spermidine/putrescine transport system permease protein